MPPSRLAPSPQAAAARASPRQGACLADYFIYVFFAFNIKRLFYNTIYTIGKYFGQQPVK
jgi:hypothetical protein